MCKSEQNSMETEASLLFYKYLLRIYHAICIIATLSLVVWCISLYLQNNDVSRVDYQKFHATQQDIYPSFSLCFSHVLEHKELKKYDLNESIYWKFLKGALWDERFMAISYENITINPIDYLLAIEMYQQNYNGEPVQSQYYLYDKTQEKAANSQTTLRWKPKFYVDNNPFSGVIQKCLTVDVDYIPLQQLSWLTIVMDKSIFEKSKRPFYTRESVDAFSVNIHYPDQRLRYSKTKKDWDQEEPRDPRTRKPGSYGMNFYVFGMEVMHRRNKAKAPCNDKSNMDDENIKALMIRKINCTPPYWTSSQDRAVSDCTSPRQLKQFYEMNGVRRYTVPCRRMTQITYLYSEKFSEYYNTRFNKVSRNYFYVSLMFPDSRYKQILLVRDFNMQSLIGNAGGYIGICVGYSILQFPYLLTAIYEKIKKLSFSLTKTTSS